MLAGNTGAAAVTALNVIADELSDHGLDILGPEWDDTHIFKIANVQGALCEITINAGGAVTWEYRQVHGYQASPAEVTSMVLGFLDVSSTDSHATPPSRETGLTLKGAVGLALRARGMHVCITRVAQDESVCDVYAEVEATNPARQDRGRVFVADDGVIRWECRFSDPSHDIRGIDPGEIARAVARSLPRVSTQ